MWKPFKPKDASDLAEKGIKLARKRKDREAIRLLEEALPRLNSHKNRSNVLDQLSLCHSRIGNYDQSDHFWSLLSAQMGESGEFEAHFWSNRALNLLRADDKAGATEAFQKRVDIDNDETSKKAIELIKNGNGRALIN